MLLMIDNYDSFTYNLVQYFAELGQSVEVYRNDAINVDFVATRKPEFIVLSPGPCTPKEAGISKAVIERYAGKIPLLGVCLGHQCIGEVYGGKIVRAQAVMHGKTSLIHHDNSNIYRDVPQGFQATRYHSLVIAPDSVPECLQVTAWTQTASGARDEIMGVRHQDLPVYGLQFHPESILTTHGKTLLKNFLQYAMEDCR